MPETAPLSLVVPTLGRETLVACLKSLAAGSAVPAEIVLVDQGPPGAVEARLREVDGLDAQVIRAMPPGIARALNAGLDAATNDLVLVTHDDCTVDPRWVSTAWEVGSREPETLFTGRVKPAGDPLAVPTSKDEPTPRDYTGRLLCDVLYPNNMLLNRTMAMALGGFEIELRRAAEDNDFCYRWLRAGHSMRYEPRLVVWHADWRSKEELEQVYVGYGHGQGLFYAKHLRQGDLAILRFLLRDARVAWRGLGARLRGRPAWSDWRQGWARGLPRGLAEGWTRFGKGRP